MLPGTSNITMKRSEEVKAQMQRKRTENEGVEKRGKPWTYTQPRNITAGQGRLGLA